MKKIKIHWPSALLSVLLALTVWFTIAGRERVETWVNVRLELKDAPSGYVILNANTLPGSVEVRLRGPSGLIRNLTGQNIPMLLSLSSLEQGHNLIPLSGDDIPISGAFDIMEIRPSAIELNVDLQIEKDVELRARSAHTLPSGITKVELIPPQETIKLKGPQTVLEKINKVEALVSLPAIIHQKELNLPAYISLPQGVEAIPSNITIRVLMEGKPKTITMQRSVGLSGVDVIPSNLSIKPPAVTLTVEIPFDWDEKNRQLQQVFALVQLPGGKIPEQSIELKVLAETPDNVKFISAEPKTVKIEIDN